MVKLFRKIRQQLLAEGKLKSYLTYALGEILLVMIGILLALQVNNWNEDFQLQKEEQKILKSLKLEFEDNIQALEQVLASHRETISKIENILVKIDAGGAPLADPNFPSELMNVVFGKTYDPQFGVLNSLLNSDRINLIGEQQLRNSIAKIPGLLDDYKEDEELAVKSIYDFYLPELFRLGEGQLPSKVYVAVNYLNFLVPVVQSIVAEGEILQSYLLEDMQSITARID